MREGQLSLRKKDTDLARVEAVTTPPGETTGTKRTQGETQAAGGLARPRRLIQPRNQLGDTDGDAVNEAEASTTDALWQASAGPSGSTKTVACVQGSALELGRLACSPDGGDAASKQNKDAVMGTRESDPSIVVGDGRAGGREQLDVVRVAFDPVVVDGDLRRVEVRQRPVPGGEVREAVVHDHLHAGL